MERFFRSDVAGRWKIPAAIVAAGVVILIVSLWPAGAKRNDPQQAAKHQVQNLPPANPDAVPASSPDSGSQSEIQKLADNGKPKPVPKKAIPDSAAWRDKKVSFDFIEKPLLEAVAFMREKTGADIMLDAEGMQVAPENCTVTLKVTDMKASQALDWICEQAGLGWTARPDGSILVTIARRVMEFERVTRTYDVADLLDPTGLPKWHEPTTPETVIDWVTAAIEPGTWGEKYGTSIVCKDAKLTVAHRAAVQEKVQTCLAAWRRADNWNRARLSKRVSFEFQNAFLAEAVAYLSDTVQARIVLDEGRIPQGLKVTLKASRMELGMALHKICGANGLLFFVRDDHSILITTPEHALQLEEPTRLEYDVSDLVKEPPARLLNQPNGPDEALISLVKQSVAPGTWDERHRTSITYEKESGKLAVTHVWGTVGQISDLLATLRASKPKPEPVKPFGGKKTTLKCQNTPLPDVVAFLKNTTGVDIRLDARVPAGLLVTMDAFDIELSDALDRICKMCRLRYVMMAGGSVAITTPDQVQEEQLKIYSIEDLMDEPPIALSKHPKGPGEALVELIKQSISPGTWNEREQRSIQQRNGRLVVTHVPEVHQKILELLESYEKSERAKTAE